MSVLSITSAAIAMARKAAGTPVASRDADFDGQLADLVVHLSVLKVQCALLLDENRSLKQSAGAADEPVVVGAG